ncbi:uncharacterized protein KY384_008679 [Bacidia gigantensis]|uniref:uncharacterized protein n=1 Tax=Bacidia gigantensis TaxID=2732470 RepID=UPI001D055C2E|nr:uncharacterized protein KY384_008679 [Bacidia gigantensis]KAG8526479.1 hypothetical protein KY384_008679 [Bacidia gigantensis]
MGTPEGTTAEGLPYNRGIWMAIAAFTAVAWYNVAELNIQVFLTFKRHRGLYFWSLLISSYGCVLHALGFLLKFFPLNTNYYVSVTIITIGWYAMVTGQAVVLYSRLHLVVREQRVLTAILAMIIIDAICFHLPTTVLTYGSQADQRFLPAFNVYEKLQMTAFCIQEFIISGVYVWATISLLRPVYHGRTRKVMTKLIWINLIIILMDVGLLAVEYANQYAIEATLKAMIYSIKLKLEFAVLNQLMTLANSSVNHHQNLRIEDGNEKGALAGRSKSTEYISHRYKKPTRRPPPLKRERPTAPGMYKAYSTSRMPDRASSSFTPQHPNRFQWVPALDRNAVVGERAVSKRSENSNEGKPVDVNVITNPAAYYKPGRDRSPNGLPQHDGLGGIPNHSPVLSPALTGTTLDASQPQQSRGGRRAPPPPSLELEKPVFSSGILRSQRPSVSDWAHGPDSASSPSTDEMQLSPYDDSATPVRTPGSVRNAREQADRHMAELDFMTSALQ